MTTDAFAAASAVAREVTLERLRALWQEVAPAARLEVVESSAPLAAIAVVRSARGTLLAQVSAHGNGSSVLIGEREIVCAFDEGGAASRADLVAGAVTAIVAQDEHAGSSRS